MRNQFILIFLLFTSAVSAQPYLDIATVQASGFPISGIYKGKSLTRITNDWWLANFNLPFKINSRDLILFSPGWEQRSFVNKDQDDVANYETVYFPVTYRHTLNDTSIILSATGIYRFNKARYVSFDSESEMFGGALLFTKKVSSKFVWKAGVYYNKEFFGDYWLPLFGVDWQVNDKFFITGILPKNLILDYRLSPHFHMGFSYKGIQESYRENKDDSYFKITDGQVKLFVDYYFSKIPIVLTFEAGQTLSSKYEFQPDQNKPGVVYYPEENMLFRGGISYRFVTNKAFITPQTQEHY